MAKQFVCNKILNIKRKEYKILTILFTIDEGLGFSSFVVNF